MKGAIQKKGNHLKKDITIMCLVANENTAGARKLLQKHGKSDAINHADLELKLSEAYKDCGDKRDFEKELALAHPHKDFILKYLGESTAQPTEESVKEALRKEALEDRQVSTLDENFHQMCGCPSCQQKMSNACGCGSSFSGTNNDTTNKKLSSSDIQVLGLISIVAIFGLVIYMKK